MRVGQRILKYIAFAKNLRAVARDALSKDPLFAGQLVEVADKWAKEAERLRRNGQDEVRG